MSCVLFCVFYWFLYSFYIFSRKETAFFVRRLLIFGYKKNTCCFRVFHETPDFFGGRKSAKTACGVSPVINV